MNVSISNRTVANSSKILFMAWVAVVALGACGKSPQGTALNPTSQTGIMGGVDATGTEDYVKHVVGLYDVKAQSVCSASILSNTILLTAAHCTASEAKYLRVVFAKTNFEAKDTVIQKVSAFQISPLYPLRGSMEKNTGDISIVRFEGGLPAGYEPVSFLGNAKTITDGMTVTIAGFGANSSFLAKDPKTGAEFMDHGGATTLRSADTTVVESAYSASEVKLDNSKGTGACHGDSGGPVFTKVNGKYVVFGVANRLVDDWDDTCQVSIVYATTSFYAKWIKKTADALNKAAVVVAPVVARR